MASLTVSRTAPGAPVPRSLTPRAATPCSVASSRPNPHIRACLLLTVHPLFPRHRLLGDGDHGASHDCDRRSSAVGADLGWPNLAGPGIGTSSLNGDGDSSSAVDRIDTSWETLVVLGSNGGGLSACGKVSGSSPLDGHGCFGV